MRKIWRLLLVMAIVATMSVLVGCRGDNGDDNPAGTSATAFETLTTYLIDNDMDLSDMLTSWIVGAAVVEADPSAYYILDIRSQADYDSLGHIEGAVHSTLGTVVTDAANSGGKTIVVTCYTGQSAAHAVIALRLSGYTDAMSLKWGMSGWDSVFDKWTTNVGNITSTANWTTDATATVADFADPSLTATATDGAGILAERVTAMLTGGFRGINAADVLASPSSYFVNNYWAEADVVTYGHIAGAYRIKEDLTLDEGGFNNLDPSRTIVTYCWTGQTSSMVTAYLTVLGYDAKSLKFGANAMIYDDLLTSKWSGSANFAYVTN